MADEKTEPEKAVDTLKEISLLTEIIQVATDMRHWQKTFFKDRTQRALQESKKYEKELDALLEKYNSKNRAQKELF
jgi:hypothetical protein